mmetsp:Transcript_45684/g.118066  ORF Transcript_45684/g.118066 Transcript_45684/m.118066 type:complete len:96 (+) Transcript_45684:710-997(+)
MTAFASSRLNCLCFSRFCLSSMVMLKDNHCKSTGSITKAVETARSVCGMYQKIEVEVSLFFQLWLLLASWHLYKLSARNQSMVPNEVVRQNSVSL